MSIAASSTEGELAALDAATKPAPVYPNWFIDNLVDQQQKTVFSR
ncbi:hypothetical protein [Rhizobium sp. J15]|nr:hypothetical protein [Rhizobium sp. J15]